MGGSKMPLYEYECKQCGKRVEKIQKFSDPEITTCPHCGGELERVVSAPAVQFKGGGWYSDLYASSKPKSGGDGAGAASSNSSSEKSGTTASTTSDSSAGTGSSSTASPAPSTPAASTTTSKP
jgi:putative FmdB family regulatory protein